MSAGDEEAASERSDGFFTAPAIARLCDVDLKTVHNWAAKGKLRASRTSGRHLRVWRADLADFLRSREVPFPEAWQEARPRVVLVADQEDAHGTLRRTLAKRFEVAPAHPPLAALVWAGAFRPAALVVDLALEAFDPIALVATLRQDELTRHLRVVAHGRDPDARAEALTAGASATLDGTSPAKIREALETATGLRP